MDNSTPDPTPGESICPRCNAAFTCGVIAGSHFCWCFDLPHIVPLDGLTSPGEAEKYALCLCPACLQALLNTRIHQ